MIAPFQRTGAAYGRKKRRWLFRMPRQKAERTRSPVPGKRMRTSRTVSSRRSPEKPGVKRSTRSGAARTPSAERRTARSARSVPAVRAVRRASSSRPSPRRRE
jgi:hypothetical protein